MNENEFRESPIYPLVEYFYRMRYLVRRNGKFRFSDDKMREFKQEYENEYRVIKAWLYISQG